MIDSNKLKRVDECKGKLKELIGNEGIIELAQSGICPHYIIKNPLTNEEYFYFIPSELNFWLEENYITYNKGNLELNTFVNILDVNSAPKSQVPEALYKITNLKEFIVTSEHILPSVYFLCKNGQIQYIGKAVSLASRINQHQNENVKEWDSIFYINCPIGKLNEMESSLIKFYQPILNKTSKKGLSDLHIENVNAIMK